MHPYLIDLGEVSLPWIGKVHLALPAYGLIVALGVVVAWIWMQKRAQAEGIRPEDSSSVAFWTLVGGLAGGKLGLLIVEAPWYLAHPGDLLSAGFLQAAGVIWTAVLGGIAGMLIASRRLGLPLGRLLDAAAPTIPVAQAIGRMGCLMAGCCFGGACSEPWAIVYHSQAARARTGVPLGLPLHPAPIYEALWSMAVVLPLTLLAFRWRRRPGEAALAYLASYGVGRFIVEFFRGDTVRGLWFGGRLSTSQIISAVAVPAALGILFWLRTRPVPGPEAPPGIDTQEGAEEAAPDDSGARVPPERI